MLKGESMLDYTNLFFPHEYGKNEIFISEKYYQLPINS